MFPASSGVSGLPSTSWLITTMVSAPKTQLSGFVAAMTLALFSGKPQDMGHGRLSLQKGFIRPAGENAKV